MSRLHFVPLMHKIPNYPLQVRLSDIVPRNLGLKIFHHLFLVLMALFQTIRCHGAYIVSYKISWQNTAKDTTK